MDYALYVSSFVVFVLMTIALFRRLTPSALSPISAIFLLYLTLFLLGPLFYNPAYGGGGMTFYTSFADEMKLIPKVFWMLSGVSAGVILFSVVSKKRNDLKAGAQSFRQVKITQAVAWAILVVATFAIILQVVGVGPQNVWLRHVYLAYSNRIVKKIGSPLSLMSLAMLGLVSGDVRLGTWLKRAANGFFLLFWILFAGLSTRVFALAPVLFMLGRYLGEPKNPKSLKRILIAACMAPFLVVYPLLVRASPDQGVAAIPENVVNIIGLGNGPNSVLSPEYYHVILNTIFIAVPQTEATYESGASDNWAYVQTAVNPLPGLYTDFADTMVMLNSSTPMTAIGDLLRCGVWFAAFFYVIVGFIFANLEANLRGGHGPGLVRLAQVGMAFLFVILSIQYPLRNATRPIYYLLFVELGLWVYTSLKLKRTLPLVGAMPLRR